MKIHLFKEADNLVRCYCNKMLFFTIFINNIVIPHLLRDLVNDCSVK